MMTLRDALDAIMAVVTRIWSTVIDWVWSRGEWLAEAPILAGGAIFLLVAVAVTIHRAFGRPKR